MSFTPELVLSIIVSLGTGFGAYAAIRADLATLHERVSNVRERLDKMGKAAA